MNKTLVLLTALTVAGSPALISTAQADSTSPYLTKENISRAIGAGLGAVLGAQIGHGSGKVAAVAAGTLAGYWAGGKIGEQLSNADRGGIATTTNQALNTGQPQTWRNPNTGVTTRVLVRDTGTTHRVTSGQSGGRGEIDQTPPLEVIGDYYVANSDTNVRGGPGTDYAIVDRLNAGEHIPVVGKVIGEDWYMVARDGVGSGFVYAPLLTRQWSAANSPSAMRVASHTGTRQGSSYTGGRCRTVTQEIILPDGTRSSKDIEACQRADGSWEAV